MGFYGRFKVIYVRGGRETGCRKNLERTLQIDRALQEGLIEYLRNLQGILEIKNDLLLNISLDSEHPDHEELILLLRERQRTELQIFKLLGTSSSTK